MRKRIISRFVSTLSFVVFFSILSVAYAQRRGGGRPAFSRPIHSAMRTPVSYGAGIPAMSFRLNYLPYGYYPFYCRSNLFFYYDGVFYKRYSAGEYRVIKPVLGAVVPKLPRGAKELVIDGVQYFEWEGTFYKELLQPEKKSVFVVVGVDGELKTDSKTTNPGIGDEVLALPDGSREVVISNRKYYVSPFNIYYEEKSEGEQVKFIVVGR